MTAITAEAGMVVKAAAAAAVSRNNRRVEAAPGHTLNVTGQMWNLLIDYEVRLDVGFDKLLTLEAQGRWDEAATQAVLAYYNRVEAEYKIVHNCLSVQVQLLKAKYPPLFTSLAEVLNEVRKMEAT